MSKPHTDIKRYYTPVGYKLLFSGVSSIIGTCLIQPLRLIKVRMHLASDKISTIGVFREVIKKEGFFTLYNGFSASLLKSGLISPIRLAIYYYLFQSYVDANRGWSPTYYTKLGFGVIAGTIAGSLLIPPELAFVRMACDGRNPEEVKRKYRHTFDAFKRIVNEEGILVLYRGILPGAVKHMTLNFARLSVYNEIRHSLKKYLDGMKLHICCAVFSGLVAAVISLPFDKIKTEIQNATKLDTHDSIAARFEKRGIISLWSGFTPYYLTITIHTVIVYHFVEYFNAAYLKNVIAQESDQLHSDEKKKFFDKLIKSLDQGTTLKKMFEEGEKEGEKSSGDSDENEVANESDKSKNDDE